MISAIVISFDDHKYLKDCIASVSFVDELIIIGEMEQIVRSELQHSSPIQFIESESVDVYQMTQDARKKASHKWILALEANRCISNPLSQEIIEIATNTPLSGVYNAKTRFNFMGKWMQYSGYRTSISPLLYPTKVTDSKLNTNTLKHPIDEIYLDFDSYNERLTKKAKQRASELFARKKRPNFFHLLWKPLWELKVNFVFKLGFLDGKEGFVFAYIKAFEEFKTYLFLWLMYRNLE
jgi:hypothetical protein